MKIAYRDFNAQSPRFLPCVATKDVYSKGSRWFDGYQLHPAYDLDCGWEWLSNIVCNALYEGGSAAGGQRGYSWAFIPETLEEAEHLAGLVMKNGGTDYNLEEDDDDEE